MSYTYTDNYLCQFTNDDADKVFESKELALKFAREYVGNNSFVEIFSGDATRWLFGPGDSTTTVVVRREVIWH